MSHPPIGRIAINVPQFRSFEPDLGKLKSQCKGTVWTISGPEEDALRRTYGRIVNSKDLNVEPLSDIADLKRDYKSFQVFLI